MVNIYQITLELSTFFAMASYVSAFWWPAPEEPLKQTNGQGRSPSAYPQTSYPQTGYPQTSYPGGSFSVSQGFPTAQYSSQGAWAGAWPSRPSYYDYSVAPNLPSAPYVPLQVPLPATFGSAHVQNVQLVPCLCPVTTEFGYDTAPAQPGAAQSDDKNPHSRQMFARSQQVEPIVRPIIVENNESHH